MGDAYMRQWAGSCFFFREYPFQNVVCEISAVLFRFQCVEVNIFERHHMDKKKKTDPLLGHNGDAKILFDNDLEIHIYFIHSHEYPRALLETDHGDTLGIRQKDRHFADDITKYILMCKNCCDSIHISLSFVSNYQHAIIGSSLVPSRRQAMIWTKYICGNYYGATFIEKLFFNQRLLTNWSFV